MPLNSDPMNAKDPPPGAPASSNASQGANNYGDTVASNSTLFQGNFSNFTYNSAAPEQPDFRGEYSFASRRPVTNFVARPVLQRKLEKQLYNDAAAHDGKQIPPEVVVYGSGGMGKTQLVLKYLETHRPEYLATFWIAAESPTSIERDFTQIYRLLFKKQSAKATDLPGVDDMINAVRSWFGARKGTWLFVFDNADSIEDEEQDNFVNLYKYVPRSPGVYAIITTRIAAAKDSTEGEAIEVGKMETSEAIELFSKCAKLSVGGQEGDVTAVIEELGCFALAVNLAGHYVSQTPRLRANLSKYIPEYRQQRKELLARKPKQLIHQYGESVLTTWETSYAAVNKKSQEAARLLGVLACLSPNDIFQELFWDEKPPFNGRVGDVWAHLVFCGEQINLYELEECLRVLEDYSLLGYREAKSSYEIHPLIQTWGLERLELKEQQECVLSGLQIIALRAMKDNLSLPDRLRLLSHALASVRALQGAYKTVDNKIEPCLTHLRALMTFFQESGRYYDCADTATLALAGHRAVCGDEHLETFKVIHDLAAALQCSGKLDEAASLQTDLLVKKRRALGDEHLDTTMTMSNLALTLQNQLKLDEAATLQKDVLYRWRRLLGDDHEYTMVAMNNLANTLRGRGKIDEAASLQEELLEKRNLVLGSEHPRTVSAQFNLANTLAVQGKLDEAASLQEEVLEKNKRILGDEHPDTISAQNNLANTLAWQGKLDEAALIHGEVLEKRKRILGHEHPDTIKSQNNLASALAGQGKRNEAALIQKEVLEKRKRILGHEHPDTLMAMHNMAGTLGVQDKLDEALRLQNAAIEKLPRILGNDHPDTVNAMCRLHELEQLQRIKEARKTTVLEKADALARLRIS